jgi:hypothetical protein
VVATHLGQVTVRLPRFRCTGCDAIETGVGWPSHCRSTPEFDQLQAHFAGVMPYRVAADLLKQVFPIDAGKDPETVRRHTLKIGATLRIDAVTRPEMAAAAVAMPQVFTVLGAVIPAPHQRHESWAAASALDGSLYLSLCSL